MSAGVPAQFDLSMPRPALPVDCPPPPWGGGWSQQRAETVRCWAAELAWCDVRFVQSCLSCRVSGTGRLGHENR